MTHAATARRGSARRRGITMVEAAISIVLVGVVLAAALQTVGLSRRGHLVMSDRARGQQLALDLLNEILTQDYMEAGPTRVFGREPGKSSLNRSQFTDVDDYNAWTETPPKDRSGNTLAGTAGWQRAVKVEWADPTTMLPTTQPDTGLKLVTVTASTRGMTVASITAYRSIAWIETIPSSTDATDNHSPTAVAAASKTTDVGKLDTTLNASTSSDRDNDPLSYIWNLGDGTRADGAIVNHSYGVPGTYTAVVTVYDGRGGVTTASVVLTVTP